MKAPTEIPSSEIMKTPGRYFDRVSRGETIVVTRYGSPYLIMSPPPQHAEEGAAPKSG